MHITRKVFSLLLAVCLMSSLCVPAQAYDWNLANGSIEIGFQDNEQVVSQQGGETKIDSAPVITSYNAETKTIEETSNTITISTGEGQTAQLTIQKLDINTQLDNSAIDIQDNSSAVITVRGDDNTVDNTSLGSGTNAATIHVGDGASVTIQGSTTPFDGENNELKVNVDNLTYNITGAAGIGSNVGENFTGEITITGDIYVEAQSANNGAAIGAGNNGDFAGTVNITDGADVHAEGSSNSTGIGAGNRGDFASTGAVNITDSTVYAETFSNGAGIGAGFGGDFSGQVTIQNSDVTAISGPSGKGEGAGIGAGYHGNFTETAVVNIVDSTVHAQATNGGAAIGSGGVDFNLTDPTTFSGQVNIHNSDVTAKTLDEGTPIGAPDGESDGIFNGSVSITGNSTVELIDGRNTELGEQTLIGGTNASSNGSVTVEDTATIRYWTGTRDGLELNGTTSVATQSDFAMIFKGAEVEVVVSEASVCADAADTFWSALANQIRAAKKGDEIIVDVEDRTTMPVYILELAQEYEVTLIIKWNGGEDIVVSPDNGITFDSAYVLFVELASLLNK